MDFDLGAFLPYRLATAAAQVSRALAERYRAEFGLSIPEWRVLAHLASAGEVSVRDIQVRVEMDKSKVSRAASRLEGAGYVAKTAHSGDRRLVSLSLTEEGRRLMQRLLPVALAYEAELKARLGSAAGALDAGLAALEAQGR